MAWLYPIERKVRAARRRNAAIVILAVYLVLAIADRAAFQALYVGSEHLPRLEERHWYWTFRVLGSLSFWIPMAVVLALCTPSLRAGIDRAWRLLASAVLAGAGAELLKLLAGRDRPINTGGDYVYRGLLERFTDPAGGMPSSHAAVAFGALSLLAFLHAHPRARAALLLAAAGCALTRVISGAHFLTDVYVGALLGYASARLLRPEGWHARRRELLLP